MHLFTFFEPFMFYFWEGSQSITVLSWNSPSSSLPPSTEAPSFSRWRWGVEMRRGSTQASQAFLLLILNHFSITLQCCQSDLMHCSLFPAFSCYHRLLRAWSGLPSTSPTPLFPIRADSIHLFFDIGFHVSQSSLVPVWLLLTLNSWCSWWDQRNAHGVCLTMRLFWSMYLGVQ